MSGTDVALGDICSPKQHPTIGTKDLTADGYPVFGANGRIGFYTAYTHDKETIAITCRGATCGTINVVPAFSYITGNAMALDNLDQRRADLRYLVFALRNRGLQDVISGSAQPQITRAPLLDLKIPLPPLPQQQRIAAILDQADSLRCLRQRGIDRLNSLGQAIFCEMFGPMNSDHSSWPITCFSDLVESSQIGLVRSANDTGDEFDVPYVRMDAIQRDGLLNVAAVKKTHATAEEKEVFNLRAGDFLFNTRNSRELVGKTAVVERDYLGVYNNNILRVRFKSGISSEYVHAYFRQPVAQREIETRKSGTTSVFAIYQKNLGTLPVPVPPAGLQAAFSGRVRDVNASRALHVQSLDGYASLFASLQHRAFRGEL